MVRVTVLDLKTMKYKYLKEKDGSTNYFFDPIFQTINNVKYEIWLRIDPKDPHSKTPVLDVQMWEIRDGKRIREIDTKKFVHHTYAVDGAYNWKFESIEERFILYIKGIGMIFDAILAPPTRDFTFGATLG